MNTKNMSFFHPAKLLGTWFGSGLSPKMSGTCGSIAALPFAYVIQTVWGNSALLLASIIAFFAGWWASHVYLRYTDASDPKEIVIDEVAGQWFLLSFLYATWTSYIIGLALFRFFDIVKPWPVSWSDRVVKGGLGVMLDDILAAAYPLVICVVVAWLSGFFGHPVNFEPLLRILGERHVS
jgi:phosphatidylglycerophosphatase A